jgi:ribonuclease T2
LGSSRVGRGHVGLAHVGLEHIGRTAAGALAALALTLALVVGGTGVASARHAAPPDSGAASGRFDYYLLSLSWSPTYCLTHANQTECDVRGFGFVLHGLWPQYFAGGWPERCATDQALTPEALRFARSIYPSPALISHEWSRHGVCSGLDALGYFQAADRARTSIHIPRWLDAPAARQSVTAAAIVRALHAANPGLPPYGVVVACAHGELAEVRLCLDRDLAPADCGRGVRTSCPAGPIDVPAAR